MSEKKLEEAVVVANNGTSSSKHGFTRSYNEKAT